MESGSDNPSEQDTSTVTKDLDEPEATQMSTLWWKEENWPSLNKAMERHRNPEVSGLCDAACLGLGKDTAPQQKVTNCLQSIGIKPITYENAFPPEKAGVAIAETGKVC